MLAGSPQMLSGVLCAAEGLSLPGDIVPRGLSEACCSKKLEISTFLGAQHVGKVMLKGQVRRGKFPSTTPS